MKRVKCRIFAFKFAAVNDKLVIELLTLLFLCFPHEQCKKYKNIRLKQQWMKHTSGTSVSGPVRSRSSVSCCVRDASEEPWRMLSFSSVHSDSVINRQDIHQYDDDAYNHCTLLRCSNTNGGAVTLQTRGETTRSFNWWEAKRWPFRFASCSSFPVSLLGELTNQ